MTEHRIKSTHARLSIMYITLMMIVICGMLLTPPVTMKVMAQGNEKPVAVIDGTFHVYINHTAYLDGTLSSGGAGNLDYNWTLESQPPESIASLDDSGDPQASLTPDVVGIYRVRLVVTSDLVDSDPAYATINVTKHPYMW